MKNRLWILLLTSLAVGGTEISKGLRSHDAVAIIGFSALGAVAFALKFVLEAPPENERVVKEQIEVKATSSPKEGD